MYVRVRSALDALTRGTKKDPLRIIAKWEELSKNVLDMMKDEATQAFVVTNPEALCVAQTRRVVDDLEKFGIGVGGIVLNRVLTVEAADSVQQEPEGGSAEVHRGGQRQLRGETAKSPCPVDGLRGQGHRSPEEGRGATLCLLRPLRLIAFPNKCYIQSRPSG
jgi:anion-transporting  ArsA/GET3 family ATPase